MSAHVEQVDLGKIETRLFINNEFVNCASGKTFPSINPATEEKICDVQEASAADVERAVAAAKEAFKPGNPWREMNATDRRDLMIKLADLIERDFDYLRDLEALDNGKPAAAQFQAYGSSTDIKLCIKHLRYFAGWADKLEGKTVPMDGNFLNLTFREPVGVCAAIIPWNFPALMCVWKLSPVLATGCTVVVKTSEKTPLSALHIAKLVKEAGFPAGVVNILNGYGPTAGEPLVRHNDVQKIAFTGSTAVGKVIQRAAADTLKKVTLELGGKSPLIVCSDADLDQAVAAAQVGLFLNMGQACSASSRIFVQDTVYDKFVEKYVEATKAYNPGPQFDETSNHGPLVDETQFNKVLDYIESGKKSGARCIIGGGRLGDKGYYVQPTVFTDVTDDMKIAKEEIFGPVASILKWSSVDEVIERANNTIYGLAAGVCTRDTGKSIRLARSIEAGTVWINCYNVMDASAQFGGFKQSGLGREQGEAALDNYTELKTVILPIDR